MTDMIIKDENTDKSIKPCDDFIEVYRELTSKYFDNYFNTISFCIALGWKAEKFIPPKTTKHDGVRLSILIQNVPSFRFLYHGISLARNQDLNSFSNDEEHQEQRIQIAQGYLNGGLSILQSKISSEININKDTIRNILLREIFNNERGLLEELFS